MVVPAGLGFRRVVYFNGSACRGETAEPLPVTAWRVATAAAVRCMNHTCTELSKIPRQEAPAQQLHALRNAKKRLEAELEECKSNSQLKRYKLLQNDVKEADKVIEALRAELYERGLDAQEVDNIIDRKALRGERVYGASRELLQREVRQLRALQEGDAITSRTSAHRATGNGVELCKAPRPAHRRELSAHSELIADIQGMIERLVMAAEDVHWEVPVPPEMADVEVQVEGLEPTPAERLAMELERMCGVVDSMGATHKQVHAKVLEATGILDENLSDQERQVLLKSRLADAMTRASAAEEQAKQSAGALEALQKEVKRLRGERGEQEQQLKEARARLLERERVINELQGKLVSELAQVREVQLNTARDTMATLTSHHTQQAVVMKDVREAAMESVARAEDHGRRIDGLTVAQERHAEAARETVSALERETSELRSTAKRLEQDNRNMTHKVTAQAALVGHVRRMDRDLADRLGTNVAGALGRILPDKLNVKGGGIHAGTSPPPSEFGGPPGLWAYCSGSEASTVTEDAESRSVVAPNWWLLDEAKAVRPQRDPNPRRAACRYTTERRCPAVLCKGENSYAAEEDDSVELSDVESWDSLHELHAPALAPGARVYPPSIASNARASNRPEGGKVVRWLGRVDTEAEERSAKTDGLLADSRALRTELHSLLNVEEIV